MDNELRAKAEQMGLAHLYKQSEDFRENFRFLNESVEKLPEHLIEQGRDLIYPQLHNAVLEGEFDLVQALLDIGVGPDAYTYLNDDQDDTPLENLAERADIDFGLRTRMATLLIDRGAYLDEALVKADDNNDQKFMEFLQEQIS